MTSYMLSCADLRRTPGSMADYDAGIIFRIHIERLYHGEGHPYYRRIIPGTPIPTCPPHHPRPHFRRNGSPCGLRFFPPNRKKLYARITRYLPDKRTKTECQGVAASTIFNRMSCPSAGINRPLRASVWMHHSRPNPPPIPILLRINPSIQILKHLHLAWNVELNHCRRQMYPIAQIRPGIMPIHTPIRRVSPSAVKQES